MAYREPGAYVTVVDARPSVSTTPSLYPAIVGEGRKFIDLKGVSMKRAGTGTTDVLPSTKVTAIVRVYTVASGVETTVTSSNYSLTAPNILTWSGAPDITAPVAGAAYVIDYEARPEVSNYDLKFVTNFKQLEAAFDGMFMKTTSGGAKNALNPVFLGAYLALESGSAGVKVLQVMPADTTTYAVVDTDFTAAMDNHLRYDASVYRIVPMSRAVAVVNATVAHVNTYSTVEERKERTTFVSKTILAADKTALVTELKGYATGFTNKRVSVVFPDKATKVLSDGKEYELTGEYLCAALAGVDAVIPVHRALTRQRVLNFTTLRASLNAKFTRTEMNDLAAAGILLLDQPGGSGTSIIVRHGITTKMDLVSNRENSVVKVVDYVSKMVRNTLEAYIGVNNINSDTIAKVKGSLDAVMDTFVRNQVINGSKDIVVAQDAANPDTLLVSFKIQPAYPCNYVDVTLIVE